MNSNISKRILGLAAVAVVALGTYTAVDSFAHGVGGPGYFGNNGMMGPGMMGRQGGWTGHQGMMGHQGGWTTGHQGGWMGHQGMMGPGMVATNPEVTKRYLDNLKTQLGITAKQVPAWDAFATAVTKQTTTHAELIGTMHGAVAPTAVGGTDQHLEAMDKAIQRHQDVYKTFQTLYGQLDARQQALVSQTTAGCPGWGGNI